jgi:hypothetical protein
MVLADPKTTKDSEITLKLPETTLKRLLDLVEKDPRYTWKLERGVLNRWGKDNEFIVIRF